mmetsp:Transcript_14105/g.36036  ORF Transcript_14105/g.36036 Transcript_14105/m.36036 type:complete len:233 (-) Transcript_14105:118-816(-)
MGMLVMALLLLLTRVTLSRLATFFLSFSSSCDLENLRANLALSDMSSSVETISSSSVGCLRRSFSDDALSSSSVIVWVLSESLRVPAIFREPEDEFRLPSDMMRCTFPAMGEPFTASPKSTSSLLSTLGVCASSSSDSTDSPARSDSTPLASALVLRPILFCLRFTLLPCFLRSLSFSFSFSLCLSLSVSVRFGFMGDPGASSLGVEGMNGGKSAEFREMREPLEVPTTMSS